MEEIKNIKIFYLIYREDLYPRINSNPEQIQNYSENLDRLHEWIIIWNHNRIQSAFSKHCVVYRLHYKILSL